MEMSDSDGSALNCECVATTSDAASQTTNDLAGRLSVATWLLHTWRYAFARTATTALGESPWGWKDCLSRGIEPRASTEVP